MKKVTWKGIKKFVSENKVPMIQLGVMVAIAAVSMDASFANDIGDVAGENGFSTLTGPMNKMKNFMTGPAPKAIGTIGVGIAGASWALNIENQVTKAGMRLLGGTGAAIGAGSLLGNVTTGILML